MDYTIDSGLTKTGYYANLITENKEIFCMPGGDYFTKNTLTYGTARQCGILCNRYNVYFPSHELNIKYNNLSEEDAYNLDLYDYEADSLVQDEYDLKQETLDTLKIKLYEAGEEFYDRIEDALSADTKSLISSGYVVDYAYDYENNIAYSFVKVDSEIYYHSEKPLPENFINTLSYNTAHENDMLSDEYLQRWAEDQRDNNFEDYMEDDGDPDNYSDNDVEFYDAGVIDDIYNLKSEISDSLEDNLDIASKSLPLATDIYNNYKNMYAFASFLNTSEKEEYTVFKNNGEFTKFQKEFEEDIKNSDITVYGHHQSQTNALDVMITEVLDIFVEDNYKAAISWYGE